MTSQREDSYIRLRHLRDRFTTATSTSMELLGGRVTAHTIRNRLRTAGLRARRPYFGPNLTRVHRQQRLLWTRRHVRFTQRQWNTVVFSDESRFTLSFADGRIRAWRRRGERHAQCCVREVDRFGGGNLMAWGAFTSNGRSRLVVIQGNMTAQVYYDQVLRPVLVPFINNHGPGLTFQHDNARPHTAALTRNFLQNAGIPVMNPIEH